jgi:hypothetical protein
MTDQFIDEISRLNPSTLVNDENANLPHLELAQNVTFLMNLLTVSSASSPNFLSLIYGNLLDYDNKGNKLFFNGGNLDCFEKKHAWIAVDDGKVVNDTDIQTTAGAERLLVYHGAASSTDDDGEHGRWIEREFLIPPFLRGSEMVFAVKGTGVNTLSDHSVSYEYEIPYCDTSTVANVSAVGLIPCMATSGSSATSAAPDVPGNCQVPDLDSGCVARYEDIGIDVLGAQGTVQVVRTLGPWPHHKFYAEQPSWLPEYRTISVSFRVPKNTEVIKIRIRRTRGDGAIAISQMFLGGLPMPYADYDLFHLDINELYNYNTGVTKWNVSTVNGRHVAETCGNSKLPNLMTKEQFLCMNQFNKNIDEFDWDQLNGPRQTELMFSTTTAPSSVPKTHVLEFDPEFTRFAYFDMRVDGPNPGLCYLGISYFVNENEFSEYITCAAMSGADPEAICGYVKFNVSVGLVNTGEFGNPDEVDFKTFSYRVPVPVYMLSGKMGYFEVYGDFYQDLLNTRGAIAYFIVSRDGESDDDTFEGNFLLAGAKTGIAVPPDDIPDAGSYPDLFAGENSEC